MHFSTFFLIQASSRPSSLLIGSSSFGNASSSSSLILISISIFSRVAGDKTYCLLLFQSFFYLFEGQNVLFHFDIFVLDQSSIEIAPINLYSSRDSPFCSKFIVFPCPFWLEILFDNLCLPSPKCLCPFVCRNQLCTVLLAVFGPSYL
jgi:hypothetical protein